MGERRRVVVTGATGFLGGHLARRLIADGCEVHAILRPTSGGVPDGVIAHVHDGSTEAMVGILGRVRPQTVFHLASLFLASHTADDIDPLVVSNVLFGTQLLEAMAEAGCTNLVNAGTGWQHFGGPAYNPVNLYAATKQAFEDIARYYVARGIGTTTLVLYDSYGAADPRPKVLSMLIDAARNSTRLQLSPGEQLLQLVHVDDIVQAFVVASRLQSESVGPAYHRYSVATQHPVSLRDLAAAVEEATGLPIEAEWGARPYRDREVMVPWVGCPVPGWEPSVTLQSGLIATLRAGESTAHAAAE